MPSNSLDEIDRELLRQIQVDAALPLHALGELVGLSGAAVQRRLGKLRRSGIVTKTVALVDAASVGLNLTIVVHIACERDSPGATADLEATLANLPDVRQAYRVTGSHDFTVILTVADMDRYNEITEEIFAADPNIVSYQTHVALKTVRDSPQLPL